MNQLIKVLPVLCFCFQLHAQTPEYEWIWTDDFNGTTFNEEWWTKIPRDINPDWQRHMSNHDSLYEVRDGNLILRGVVNNGTDPSDSSPYLTGGLYTKDKKTIRYGKIEVCAKLQGARGAWPAIWMLPNDYGWPDGGEIDIMERLNNDSIAYQTVHSNYTEVQKKYTPRHSMTAPIDPDGYNTYAVEILPDSLVFSINGKTTLVYPRLKPYTKEQYPFGTPFYLLVDMQIGGNWVGEVDPDDYPVEMWIDRVTFYAYRIP